MCVINTAYFCNNSDWNSYNYAFNVFIKNVRMFSVSFSRFFFNSWIQYATHTHKKGNTNALKVKKIDLPPNGNSFLAKMGNSETDSHWICALQCVFCHNILLPFLWPLNLAKPLFHDSSSLRIDVIVLLLLSFYIFDEDLKNFFISFPFHLIWWFFGISMCYCSTKFNRQTHA